MIVLKLTEYRANGQDYPIIIFAGENIIVREAQLEKPGPQIIGESKVIGTGSFITIPFTQHPITVRETPTQVSALITAQSPKRTALPRLPVRNIMRQRKAAPPTEPHATS